MQNSKLVGGSLQYAYLQISSNNISQLSLDVWWVGTAASEYKIVEYLKHNVQRTLTWY